MGLSVIAACGDNRSNREQVTPAIVVRTDPASAADCPYGGSVVSSGFDDSGDGALDDVEIESRTVLCNDAPVPPPPPIVVRLVVEPAGPHCALRGTAVESGPDHNGNGRLDDDEVTHVDYVCGDVLLTRLATEPPGSRCVAGGVAFLIGRDRNHDGQLGDDEVEETDLECGHELSRDVTLQSAADVAALENITAITGSLAVADTGLTELVLPRLVQVRGALEINNNASLIHIAMPVLQSVDGRVNLALDGQLTTIEMPQLHRLGSLVIDGDAALHDLSGLPMLTDVLLDVQISGNDSLASADLPVTQLGGDLTIDGNAQLAHVSWVAGTGSVRITANPRLETVDLPVASRTFGGLGALTISSNAQLGRISMNVEQLDAIRIEDNARLSDIAVTTFQVLGDVVVRGNGPLRLTLAGDSSFQLPIAGSLSLAGPIETFDTPVPLAVTGDCTIDGTQLASLGTPNQVMRVAGSLALTGNPRLTAISFLLVGANLEVRGNAALSTLRFLAQDQIDGSVTIEDNAALEAVPSLEALRRIRGNVRIVSNPALKAAFGHALERVDGDLTFDGNDSLDDLGLVRIAHARSLSVAHCGSLTELDLPALSDAISIEVRGNATLGHLQLPVLRSADLGVFDNPRLPACEVTALFAAVLGDHHQSGNDEVAVCTP
jgi:hypothetical protein